MGPCFPDSSVGKESACNAGDLGLIPGLGKIHSRRDRLPLPVFLGFPCGSAGKESVCSAGDLGLILGLGRSPGEGKGYPLQYSGLKNSTDYTSSWGHKESNTTEQLKKKRKKKSGLDSKESNCNAGNLGSNPRLGKSPGEGNGNQLQHSCLENSVDRGAWQAVVTKSCAQLRN